MVEVRPLKFTPIPEAIVANTTHNTILFAHALHDDPVVVICLQTVHCKKPIITITLSNRIALVTQGVV